jgi:putative transposase
MARLPRLTVPGQAHHIIQRGNNGQPVFGAAADYHLLLGLVDEHARKQQVAAHAYVLMANQFHLLATPETEEGIPQMMQAVGRRYVRNYNLRNSRTGTLWEGRYRSTVIQAERHLLACMVYLDLRPVDAGLASDPAEYPWSSHQHYTGRRTDKLITPHPLYWELGNTPFARDEAYGALVRAGISESEKDVLTNSALRGWALGEPDYVADLQRRIARRVSRSQAGRPPKPRDTESVPN